MAGSTYLDEIMAFHRKRAASDERLLSDLIEVVPKNEPRGFMQQIKVDPGLSVIAEIKRRSPSKGLLKENLNPSLVAHEYETSGATCISVLTDTEHFWGSETDLKSAKEASSLPILRKDFTVDLRDICDARIMGADCVLLIVSALDKKLLQDLHQLAHELGIDALVETHDEREIEIALQMGATLIGVNQRDLKTFQVDQTRAIRVIRDIPETVTKVAESGIRNSSDAEALSEAGYDAVLIGEALVTAESPSKIVRELKKL